MTDETSKVWLEDGILYNEYTSHLTMPIALDASRRSLELLKEHHLAKAPVIADFSRVAETDFHLKLTEYAAITRSLDLLRHLSGIWIVGAKEAIRKSLEIASKAFLGSHIYFVDSMEEAKRSVAQMAETHKDVILP